MGTQRKSWLWAEILRLCDGDMLVAYLLCFLDWGFFPRLKTEQVGFFVVYGSLRS